MYLTFDVGTTSVKTVLYDSKGELIYKVIKDYQLHSPQIDWYEVNPEVYWHTVINGFKEILDKSGVLPDCIKAISGCSQGETIILLDETDTPVRPAIVWIDNRARDEIIEIKKFIDEEEFYRVTGLLKMEPTWSVFKILWIKNNEEETFKKIKKVFLVEDYIVYKLTGRYVSSSSLLASSGLIDIHKRKYWNKTVDYLNIGEKLPEIIEEGSIVGKIKKDISSELGLKNNVIIVKGSMDQTTSAVGAGNINPGIITETTGSAMAVAVTADKVKYNNKLKLPYQPHVVGDKYLILPYAQTAGIIYKWFADEFTSELVKKEGSLEHEYNLLDELASSIAPGSEGLIFLPFLAGASFPENNSYAKGVFFGITLKHGKAHFVRAILESVGYMLKKILSYVEKYGIQIEEIRAMGGGARSDLWLQIKADVTGYKIVKMKQEETSTLGAAILAATKAGDFKNIEEAVQNMVKKGMEFIPNQDNNVVYQKNYRIYHELYRRLEGLFTLAD